MKACFDALLRDIQRMSGLNRAYLFHNAHHYNCTMGVRERVDRSLQQVLSILLDMPGRKPSFLSDLFGIICLANPCEFAKGQTEREAAEEVQQKENMPLVTAFWLWRPCSV